MASNKGGQAVAKKEETAGKSRSNGAILIIAALDMSWRLAIVVLVPIIGGFELDKHLGSTPALTIVGFLAAMAGLFFIMKRTLAAADTKFKASPKR
jgi:F0F1-type ATP synthase assembly protein I